MGVRSRPRNAADVQNEPAMSPTHPSVVDVPGTETGVQARREDMCQVVLFNDEHNRG